MTATQQPVGVELIEVDPHTLDVGKNVRDRVDLDATPGFVASIREHGVLHPITANRREDGVLVVIDGQRRLLAARATDRDTIPVLVRSQDTADEVERALARISEQMNSNNHRTGLTTAQNAAGVAEMLDLGVPVERVSKELSVKRKTVKLLGAVGRREAARAILEEGLTIEQAAVVAKFEADGDTEAVQVLVSCHRNSFDYQARTLLADRQEKATRAERTAPYADAGFTVLDGEPGYQDDSKIHWRYIATAEDAEADPRAHITEEQVRQRPDLWGVWVTTDTMYVDVESGEPVEEGDIDWDTFDDPDVKPEEGLRHANSVEERDVYVPQFYFLDVLRAEEAGLVPVNGGRYQFNRAIQLAGFNPANPLPENEEAREAALLAAEETKRVQRRRVRELNKLAESATDVRRELIREMLSATKPPKNAATWTAMMIALAPHQLSEYHSSDLLPELMGEKTWAAYDAKKKIAAAATAASESRAWMLTFAVTVAAMESRMAKDAWRSRPQYVSEYLGMLTENGHTLSNVEKVISGELRPEDIDIT
ncbi:ParB/RepB/Spo0J family partition protein [Rhodococcus sp. MSC1_016]|jgi:ParB family chromosome partitioning protein|uniref:ParB/RepB/Spo0J family partition protein n=1 Tax=Rhodococcus sp. MSC1_016 TaxID=2909266 RepID=UPI00202F026F|nr:ParB/RepB/Spo0J family partition protein [Rhodococcus sp. MSC1_016]